ncbi:MAG: hypothetical protein U9O20_04125 [Patescibacteria group bacterium]|nr:hypothetical protein [Patescibacteria group bacterium]
MLQDNKIDLRKTSSGEQNSQVEEKNMNNEKPSYSEIEDEEEQNIPVSNSPDSMVDENNGSEEDDRLRKTTKKARKYVVAVVVVIAVFVLSAGGIWGMELYERFFKSVPIKEVLPGDVEVVLLVNLDPESSQYALLDEHIKKFPGHKHLMKELDNVGEGKTLSQFMQDKLKQHGLDFHRDIKPVLGETGYVLIPKLDPIEKEFQKKFSWLSGEVSVVAKNYFAFGGDLSKVAQVSTEQDTRVLGTTSDYFTTNSEKTKVESVDFVIGAEIEDLKEAQRVIEKMKTNINAYEISDLKHQGYDYFKITNKKVENDEGLVCIKDTYHAIVGRNWVMATIEDDVKRIIENRKNKHALTQIISFNKAQAEDFESLEDNEDFHMVLTDLQAQNSEMEKSLLSVFFKTDFGEFFDFDTTPSGSGTNYSDYFKYPEPYIGGFFIKAKEEGIVFRSTSNQFTFDEADNMAIDKGLVEQIPNQMDNRWADVFLESDNVKSMYYSFKRNNLTSKGLKEWNKARGQLNQMLGLDFEKDFIDQLTGSLAFVAYTRKGFEPEMVILGDVESNQKVIEVVTKVIEVGKQMYLGMNPNAICFQTEAEQQTYGNMYGAYGTDYCSEIPKEQKKLIQKQIEAIKNSTLVEAETEFGKMYSYKIPETSLSFDLGFKDGKAIFGSHHAIVLSAMKDLGANTEMSIAKSKKFGIVSENVFSEGYSKSCVNTLGLWSSVEYYVGKSGIAQAEEDKEMFDAIGAMIRTVNLLGSAEAISSTRKDAISSMYLGIKELPEEEKKRADKFIDAYW